jgi:hypothetical protein
MKRRDMENEERNETKETKIENMKVRIFKRSGAARA